MTSSLAAPGALEFRKDINGLRAYAVLAVLLYHFGAAGLSGGYAGVDVFFVISGFLMTAIILPKVEEGRFSLTSFYLARVRRILPALLVLCVAVLAFGWFWLAPYLYARLGKNAGASLLFISNFTYNRAGGYFAAPAHDNWLLHTWSLSVEWQFYLLYPLLLLALAKWRRGARRFVAAALGLILIASLAMAIFLTWKRPTSAFFMLPTRAWELLAGSLVFLFAGHGLSRAHRLVAEALGLLCIATAFLAYDQSTPWPGYHAVLPVLGTVLILLAGRQDSPWTGNPLAQHIGRWSYSIYLWHWPLVVGLGYFGVRQATGWWLAALAASLALGALSFHFVEQAAARWLRSGTEGLAWRRAAAGFAAVFAYAAAVHFDQGVPRTWRLPEAVLMAAREKENIGRLTKCNSAQSQCVLGQGKLLAVVWGDSHAIAAVEGVAAAARQAGGSILFFGQQACPAILGAKSSNPRNPDFCKDFNAMVFARLQRMERHIPVVVIQRYVEPRESHIYFGEGPPATAAARLADYTHHMVDTLCRVAARRPVYVTLPLPEMPDDVPAMMSRSLILTGQAPLPRISLATHLARQGAMIAALQKAQRECGVHLLDPLPYFCDSRFCYGASEGRPLYFDDNHLSLTGARLLTPLFAQIWAGHAL
jgi:peptidoglycan/LPS O-acetylase OafA/YrhL